MPKRSWWRSSRRTSCASAPRGIVRALVANPNHAALHGGQRDRFLRPFRPGAPDMPAFQAPASASGIGGGREDGDRAAAKASARRSGAVEAAGGDRRRRHAGETPEEPKGTRSSTPTARSSALHQAADREASIAKEDRMGDKKGNRSRTILLRDPNKLVQLAVVRARASPTARSPRSPARAPRPRGAQAHLQHRLLMKNYTIKVNLVNNPRSRWRWDAIPLDPAAERAQVGVQEPQRLPRAAEPAQKLWTKKPDRLPGCVPRARGKAQRRPIRRRLPGSAGRPVACGARCDPRPGGAPCAIVEARLHLGSRKSGSNRGAWRSRGGTS